MTQDGIILKASTVYIRKFKDEIIGSLCINYNRTTLIIHLEQITTFNNSDNQEENTEFFPTDVIKILDTIFNQLITAKGISVEDMKKKDKMEIVGLLDIKDAFLIKGSTDKAALALGVSTRYTIYNYLE
ncbi:MAG: helix-turn-helix domain-containing protein [Bacillota bacterium]|nr:helix-turn-helix domain-containing protein [Bacillota bacterium]